MSELGELDFDIEIDDLDFLAMFDLDVDFDFGIEDGGMKDFVENSEIEDLFSDGWGEE